MHDEISIALSQTLNAITVTKRMLGREAASASALASVARSNGAHGSASFASLLGRFT